MPLFSINTVTLNAREIMRSTIDANTSIGHDHILGGRNGFTTEPIVNLSTQAYIWTIQNEPMDPDIAGVDTPVTIGEYVWLSCPSAISPLFNIAERNRNLTYGLKKISIKLEL